MVFQVLAGPAVDDLTDITSSVLVRSLTIREAGHSGIAVADFVALEPPVDLASEWFVRILDGATRAFEGKIRGRTRTDTGLGPAPRKVYDITCQDTSAFLTDDVVDGEDGLRGAETGGARVIWLIGTYSRFLTAAATPGGYVQTGGSALPDQDLRGLNLFEAMEAICSISGYSFHTDYEYRIHYYGVESEGAPFNLSNTPNGTTTFGYRDLQLPDDTFELTNAVYVRGGGTTTPFWWPDPATWPTASMIAYGRREAALNYPDDEDQDHLLSLAKSYIAYHELPRGPARLKVYRPGLRAGQRITLTNSLWGLSAVDYPIVEWRAQPMLDDRNLEYTITLGDRPVTLSSQMAGTERALGGVGHLVGGIQPVLIVDTLPDAAAYTGRIVLLTTDMKLYQSDGVDWIDVVANIPDGSIGAEKMVANTLTAGTIAAGAIGASELAADSVSAINLTVGGVGTGNILRNGSFEDATGAAATGYSTDASELHGWQVGANSKVWLRSGSGFEKTGDRVAYVAVDSGTPAAISAYQRVPVQAGRRYRVSGWYGMATTQYSTSPDTIAKRASTTAATNNGLYLEPALPAGLAPGDLMVAVVTNRKGTDGTITAPAGWTQRSTQKNSTTVLGAAVFTKIAAGHVDGTLNETVPRFYLASANTKGAVVLMAFSGVDGSTPVVAVDGQVNASSTNIDHPALTSTGHEYRLILSAIANDSTINNVATWTGPGADETVASAGGQASSRNRVAIQRKADTADNPGSVTATAGTAAVNIGFQMTLNAGTLIVDLRSARLVANSISKAGALVGTAVLASPANGTGTTINAAAEYTIPTDGSVSYLDVYCQVQGNPTTAVGVFEEVVCREADLISGAGDVVIDGTGIAVANGKITVSNPGSVVVIDGTSNLFKIAAAGTIETVVTGSVITSATVNLGTLGGTTPAYEAFTGTTLTIDAARKSGGDNPQWESPSLYYAAAASGGSPTTPLVAVFIVSEIYMRLTAGEAIVTMDVTCSTGASFSSYGTYYIYKESAI